jgi:hypothetical protein
VITPAAWSLNATMGTDSSRITSTVVMNMGQSVRCDEARPRLLSISRLRGRGVVAR